MQRPELNARGKSSITYPANICLFKGNNRDSSKKCEVCSRLTLKKPE